MTFVTKSVNDTVVRILNEGGVGIVRTDTLYGIVALAAIEDAVATVYDVKGRTPSKPPIVLISDYNQLFDTYDEPTMAILRQQWPGPRSIVLPSAKAPVWITRGSGSVAYRMPDNEQLIQLLNLTGPLIAPSANPEGLPPALNVNDARNYFGAAVDFYVDGGVIQQGQPSALLRLQPDGSLEKLR